MKNNKVIVNRRGLAHHFGVSLPTVDDWTRRGCPCIASGQKGQDCEFSIPAVEAWREADLRRRGIDPHEHEQQNQNPLRMVCEDGARYFCFSLFNHCAGWFLEDAIAGGLDAMEARKLVARLWINSQTFLQRWVSGDFYNRLLQDQQGVSLDDYMRRIQPRWKGVSAPGIITDDDCDAPPGVGKLMDEFVKLKKKAQHRGLQSNAS